MAQRIIGVSKRLIEAATEEFLKNGFEGSSVRIIAQKAQTSPRAIYTRFENKEALFEAVIEPAYSNFLIMFKEDKVAYWENARKGRLPERPEEYYTKYLEYAYNHKKQFRLLLVCSTGSRYEKFTEMLAQMDLEYLRMELPAILKNQKGFSENVLKSWGSSDASRNLFFENVTYSFYHNLFVPFVKNMTLEEAKDYIIKLTQFYTGGIAALSQG